MLGRRVFLSVLLAACSWTQVHAENYALVSKPVCTETIIDGFTHPGIFHTCEDLTRMQQKVWAGEEPWKTAFGRMFSESLFALAVPSVNAYHIRGPLPALPYGEDAWSSNFTVDAQYAYLNAVAYFVTGHPFHRERVLHTARRWLTTLSLLEEYIRGCNGLRYLTAACEIFRSTTTTGWTANDTALYNSFAQRIRRNWDNTNGCARPDLFFNQGAYGNGGALALAVFVGDVALYQQVIRQATKGANPDPTIDYAIGLEISNSSTAFGQVTEMGRDQGHPAGWLNILSTMAYTAEIQGTLDGQIDAVSLFEYDDYRLLAGLEYYARYNLGYDVPWEAKRIGFDATEVYAKVANDTSRGMLYRTQQHPTDIGALNSPTAAYYRYRELVPDRVHYLKTYVEAQTKGWDTLVYARPGNFEDVHYIFDNGYGGSYMAVIAGSASKRFSQANETVEARGSHNSTLGPAGAPDIAVLQGNTTVSFPLFWKTVTKPFLRIEARSPSGGADLTVRNQTALVATYHVPAGSAFSTVYVNTTLPANPNNQLLFLSTSADVEIARFNMTEATDMVAPFVDS